MNSAARSVRQRFSKAAPRYHEGARLQAAIAADLSRRLRLLSGAERILDIGCGTGFLTAEVCRLAPLAEVWAVDLSPRMIAEAKARHPQLAVEWREADARNLSGFGVFDCVISSSALQWVQPLTPFFAGIAEILSTKGRLIFSLMVEGTLKELHAARAAAAPDKPARRALPSPRTVKECLCDAGFYSTSHELMEYREHYSSARSFLHTIHELGFTGGELSVGDKRLSRGELLKLEQIYQERYRAADGRVYGTYQTLVMEAEPLSRPD